MRAMQIVLFFVFVLAVWKLFDLFFPEKTTLGKRLVKNVVELRLTKAFYKDFLCDIINKDKSTEKHIEEWMATEFKSWLAKKAETGELSDIIETKE